MSSNHSAKLYELYMDRESFRGAVLTNFGVNFYKLPDVDDKFNQAYADYQQKVTQAYKSLLDAQLSALDPEAKQIWENGSHKLLKPVVAIKPGTGTRWESSGFGGYSGASSGRRVSYTTDQWENWDRGTAKTGIIIEASLNGQKRFYTATWGNEVNFKALPANVDQYTELESWVLANRDKLFTGKDLEQAQRAVHTSSTSSRVLAINVQRAINRTEASTKEAIAAMAGEYTNEFKDASYQQTARQQSMEMLLDMLVPFYGFAQAIKKGNVGEAIISGFADFLSLIPVAGAAGKLGGTALKTGFKVANIAARQALKAGLKTGTKAAFQAAIKASLQTSAKLAPNLAKNSGRLLLETIDFFNPLGGIDQLGKRLFKFSDNAVKQIANKLRATNVSLANKLDSLTELSQPFSKSGGTWSVIDPSKITTNSNGLRVYTHSAGEQFELLNWNGLDNVPFKTVNQQDGSQALVAVNPNTGKGYGPTWKKGPALSTARNAETFNHPKVTREQVGNGFVIYSNKGADGNPSHAKRLVITAHGAYVPRPELGQSRAGGFIDVPEDTQLKFYGPHKKALEDPGIKMVTDKELQVYETLQNGDKVRNYRLWNYEPDTENNIKFGLGYEGFDTNNQLKPASERYDVLTIRPDTLKGKTTGYTLNELLKTLKENGYDYDEIHCVFCRWRPGGGSYSTPKVNGEAAATTGKTKGLEWLLGKSATGISANRLAEQFADNTEQFAQTHLINNMKIMDPGLRGTYKLTNPANPLEGRIVPFRFTSDGNKPVKLQAVPEELATPQDIRAYHLPYNGDQSKGVPFVDIPKTDPAADQLFTGGLNGCSIIVADHPTNSTLLRVYHDAHPTKNVAAKPYHNSHIYGRVDYDDYQRTATQGELAINAAAFMKFDHAENKWELFYQPQVLKTGPAGFEPEQFSDSLQKVYINT
ncbi:putative adhesin [Spartinivicinus ruber]|uniref:putative adhesin n=1 Tax=Spartinivicinus ruber TaxID=2683272 RepID=UPI0013D3B339|nr:hypothetical protein [Spartinivicinus ruber]